MRKTPQMGIVTGASQGIGACLVETLRDKGQPMQATAITAFGGLDQLKLVGLPMPPCGPDQILINVQAAGVGMWDVKVRQGSVGLEGQRFPLVLGWESAGIIEQVGTLVTGLAVGTPVICATYQVGIGHYAHTVAVLAAALASCSHQHKQPSP